MKYAQYALVVIGIMITGLLAYMAFKPQPKPEVKVISTPQSQTPITQTPTVTTQPKQQVQSQPTKQAPVYRDNSALSQIKPITPYQAPVRQQLKPLPTAPKATTCTFQTNPVSMNREMVCR